MPRRHQNQQDFPPFFFNTPGQGVDNHNPWDFATIFGADPRGPPPPPPPPPPRDSWGHWAGGPGAAWAYSPWADDHDHHSRRRSRHGRCGGYHRRHGRHASDGEDDINNTNEAQATSGPTTTNENEKDGSADTMNVDDAPDPEEVVIEDDQDEEEQHPHARHARCRRGGPFGRRMRGGPRGGGGHRGRGGIHNAFFGFGPGAHHHHHHPHPSPPPYDCDGSGPAPFNFGDMMRGLTGNPIFQNFRQQFINSTRTPHHHHHHHDSSSNNNHPRDGAEPDSDKNEESPFNPPIDIFNTPASYIIHIALPGAKKEDVAINWDPESHLLAITGIVHRPGDEEFLNTLVSAERRIGMFEREIMLPPVGSERGDEVDGEGIGAKMENGILVISVPKVEKEWTEVRKVDIE